MISMNGLFSKEIYEAATLAGFPSAGVAARLYIADDTGNVYRWSETAQAYALIGGSGSGGGTIDHGALTGLTDDDHPQYLTQERADIRYAIQGSGGSGVTDHGVLTGLADDDHPHYYNQARGDARYSLTTHGHAVATGSVDGFFSAANFTKLAGIATAATANATDAQLRDRTTHTGAQAISTVTGLQAALDGKRATGAIGINELSSGGATNGQVLKFDSGSGQWLPGNDLVGSGGGGGAVDSVFGRIGAVVSASGDYTFAQIGSKPTTLSGYGITDAAPASHVGAGGTAHANVSSTVAGFMSAADKTKLDGIPSNATANSSDATLLARANHTGSQAISSVSGLQAALDAKHANIQFRDEGSNLGTSGTVDVVDFTGLGVSVSRASNVLTVNVPITNDPSKAPLTPTAENIATGSAYTVVVADEGKVKRLVDAAAQTVHLTTAMNGKSFTLRKVASAGAVTIDVNAGCNVNGLGDAVNLAFSAAGGAIYFQPTGTNTWDAWGSIGDLVLSDITNMPADARTFNAQADYAAMRTVLGVQPLDATLTSLAALTIAANSLSIGTGADAFSQTTFAANTFPGRSSSGNLVAKTITDAAFSLLDDADAAAMRTTLGAQPLDATLTALAGLTIAANSLSIGTGADAFSQTTFAANTFPGRSSSGNLIAKTISDDAFAMLAAANNAAIRTAIGVATAAEAKQETICIAVGDETTGLTTGTAKVTFRMPFALTNVTVRASVTTAPTGASLIVDINETGSTIMTTNKLSIDATEKTSTTAATAAGVTDADLADDAEITIDIDQVGSTVAGAGLKVYITGTR
jgi:hypothetical protein